MTFNPIPGKVPQLPEEVVKQLSRDQALAYKWSHAIQSGNVPDNLPSQTIGPLFHARWLTLAVRALAKYARTRKPTQKLKKIIMFILNLYMPVWFRVKCNPHIQAGSHHFFYMLELRQDLVDEEAKQVVKKVMMDKSYFCHPENLVVALLADPREELRRKGVLFILAARREHDPNKLPRQFLPPEINFNVGVLPACFRSFISLFFRLQSMLT